VADPRARPTALAPAHADTQYERHRPEDTVLYKTVQEHWKTFLSEIDSAAESPVLPTFVNAEVEGYLRCGILAHGLILARCTDCG